MSIVEFLSQPIWQRLGLTLVHFLWQGLVVAVLVGAFVRVFRLNHGNARYAAYLLAFAAMIVCPVVTFTAIDIGTSPNTGVVTEAESAEIVDSVSYTALPVVDILPEAEIASPAIPALTNSIPLSQRISDWLNVSMPWLLVTWIVGVVVLSVRLVMGFVGVYRWRHNLEPLPERLALRVASLSDGLGIGRFSRVFISPTVLQAMAVGYLRPMVLLPAAMVTQMQPAMLEAVIAHELAHIRRFDLWVNLAQRVTETLLFYHPAVWWLSNCLRNERELCCDALAVKVTGRRLTYAKTLENVSRSRFMAKQPILAAGLGHDNKPTLHRVRHILGLDNKRKDSRYWLAGVIAVLLIMAIIIPTGSALIARLEDKPAVQVEGEVGDAGDIGEMKFDYSKFSQMNKEDKLGFVLSVLEMRDVKLQNFAYEMTHRLERFTPKDGKRQFHNESLIGIKRKGNKLFLTIEKLDSKKRLQKYRANWDGTTAKSLLYRPYRNVTHSGSIRDHEDNNFTYRAFNHILGLRLLDTPKLTLNEWFDEVITEGGSINEAITVGGGSIDIDVVEENGKSLLMFKVTVGYKYWQWFLDVDRDYLPIRAEILYKVDKNYNSDSSVVEEAIQVDGFWVPKKVFRRTGTSAGDGQGENTYQISTFTRNTVTDKDLEIDFPPGTEVVDTIAKTAYRVLPNGSHEMLPLFDSETGKVIEPIKPIIDDVGEDAAKTDKVKRGAREAIEIFITAAMAGDLEQAGQYAHPARMPASQIADLTEIAKGQNLWIMAVLADDSSAIAVSSVIRADHDRIGPLVFLLDREPQDGRDNWCVHDIDMETPDSAEVELKRFLEKHPEAQKVPYEKNPAVQVEGGGEVIEKGYTVAGHVLTTPGGEAAAGAVVNLWHSWDGKTRTTKAVADGTYTFKNVEPSEHSYVLRVENPPGIWTDWVSINIKSEDIDHKNLYLTRPQSISGTVYDAETSEPVAGAKIRISTKDNGSSVKTGSNGKFLLYVDPRRVSLICDGTHERYYPDNDRKRELEVRAGQNIDNVAFKVHSAPEFSGQVVYSDGKGAGGVDVYVELDWEGNPAMSSAHGDAWGTGTTFKLKADTEGKFSGYFRRQTIRDWQEKIELKAIAWLPDRSMGGVARAETHTSAPHVEPIKIVLKKAATVTIRVVDPDGKPIENAKVTASDIRVDMYPYFEGPVKYLGDGQYCMSKLIPGLDYHMTAHAKGYRTGHYDRKKFVLEPGQQLDAGTLKLDWWGKKAVPGLIQQLKNPAKDVRFVAAGLLGRLGADAAEAVPHLLEVLRDDESSSVHNLVTQALGKIGPMAELAVPEIIETLKSDNGGLRREAAKALGLIGSPVAIPALKAAMNDERRDVRKAAAEAIKQIEVEKPAVQVEAEEGWGESVNGLQCRLRADKAQWDIAEDIILKADVKNTGKGEYFIVRADVLCELSVDGTWYRYAGDIGAKSSPFGPGKEYKDIPISLARTWRSKRGSEPLVLASGKHKVKVAFLPDPANKNMHGAVPRIESNEVEFEITD